MTKYTVKIQNFEGPLDLLFHLIEKNKMDIYDIQITEITDQYIAYIHQMQQINLEIASEFLVMAATLMLIKSKLMLPDTDNSKEEAEELKEDIVNRLIEYKKCKQAAVEMLEREQVYSKLFYKTFEILKIPKAKIINKIYDPKLIPSLYKEICQSFQQKMNTGVTQHIERIMEREVITIRGKIRDIMKKLLTFTKFKFSDIFTKENKSKLDVVTAFMALLELAKVKRVEIKQDKPFDEIYISKIDKEEKEKSP